MYDYASELEELIASVRCLCPLLANGTWCTCQWNPEPFFCHPPFVNLGHLWPTTNYEHVASHVVETLLTKRSPHRLAVTFQYVIHKCIKTLWEMLCIYCAHQVTALSLDHRWCSYRRTLKAHTSHQTNSYCQHSMWWSEWTQHSKHCKQIKLCSLPVCCSASYVTHECIAIIG